jgi:hypothetical protein
MKLRLTQLGFENYTGQMGVIFFKDGLSTADVLVVDATRMAAVMGCEWENGSPANVGQIYLDNMNTPAPLSGAAVERKDEVKNSAIEPSASVAFGVTYTEEQLAAIADEKGIAGLREISDLIGIKGNSIRGLIDAILSAPPVLKTE